MTDVDRPNIPSQLMYDKLMRPALLKEQDACIEYIYQKFQPLAQLAWLQVYILRKVFDECIPRAKLPFDAIFKLAIVKDRSSAKELDTEALKNFSLASQFYCAYESFLTATYMAECGHFLVCRNALRISLEATGKFALLYNETDREKIIDFSVGKEKSARNLPDRRPYIDLKNMKKHLSNTASHANFETAFYGSRNIIFGEDFKINDGSVNGCYMDIFDTYFLSRNVIFDVLGEVTSEIIFLNKTSSAMMKDIKVIFPYFAAFKKVKDAQMKAGSS